MRAALDRREFFRAFVRPGRAPGGPRVAAIDLSSCVAAGGGDCRTCLAACPLGERALSFASGVPVVDVTACDGCGACIPACEAVAAPAAVRLIGRGALDPRC